MNVLMLTNVSFKILSLISTMIVAKPPNAKTLMDLMTVNVFPVIEDVDLVMLAVVI